MLDNCNIRLYKPNIIDSVIRKELNQFTKNGVIYYQGKISNLFIKVNQDNLEIRNSIKKYINDKPNYDLTRLDLLTAIERLNNTLGVDVSESKLTKLEYGITIETEESPLNYIQKFGIGKNMKLTTYGVNAKTYSITKKPTPNRKAKSLIIYDKGIESNMDSNLLRIELRVPKRVKSSLALESPLTLNKLIQKEGYELLYNKLIGAYNMITKNSESNYSYTKPTEFKEYVFNSTINSIQGFEKYYEDNRIRYLNNDISKYAYYEVNKILKDIYQSGQDSKLINEMEKKINDRYNYLLNN